MFNKIIYLFFVLSISCYSFAGDLQGGGGGRTNASVKRYLDKRMYGLDGARRMVAPEIILVNACIDANKIHTIEPVWQCQESETVLKAVNGDIFNQKPVTNCKKKVKAHLERKFDPVQKICEVEATKIISGQIKSVCTKFSKDKVKPFKTKYRLDVYRLSIGDGGTALFPRVDHDFFERTIDYKIPNCEELNIQ